MRARYVPPATPLRTRAYDERSHSGVQTRARSEDENLTAQLYDAGIRFDPADGRRIEEVPERERRSILMYGGRPDPQLEMNGVDPCDEGEVLRALRERRVRYDPESGRPIERVSPERRRQLLMPNGETDRRVRLRSETPDELAHQIATLYDLNEDAEADIARAARKKDPERLLLRVCEWLGKLQRFQAGGPQVLGDGQSWWLTPPVGMSDSVVLYEKGEYFVRPALRAPEDRMTPNSDDRLLELALEAPIANPGDFEHDTEPRYRRLSLFRMWFGEVDATTLYVWADSLESAFEEGVEWLDDNAPGRLTKLEESDYRAAAEELGVAWQKNWPDWDDRTWEKVASRAEADLTQIGHTTLEHGQFVASWQWGGDEVTDDEEREIVETRSEEDDGEGGEAEEPLEPNRRRRR